MWTQRKRAEESSLDMTPLVDVVFLLIIFFMLSTTFIVLPGIRVDLPKASSERITLEPEEIVLSVDEKGSLFFNKERVDDETMLARLRMAAHGDKEVQILLKGDSGCSYGHVVNLLDMIRQCQLHRVAIMTKKKRDTAAPQAVESP